MRKTFLFLLLIFVAEFARSEDWTTTDKALLAMTETAIVMDWRQTQNISKNCNAGGTIRERNPIIGKCPSMGRVNTYFAASMVGTYLIADYLDGNWRKGYLVGLTVLEASMIEHNRKLGLGLFIKF